MAGERCKPSRGWETPGSDYGSSQRFCAGRGMLARGCIDQSGDELAGGCQEIVGEAQSGSVRCHGMKRRGLQLSVRHRWILYGSCLALFVTGALWAWLHYMDVTGRLGDSWRSLNPWLMKIHGFAAVGFVLVLGTLLPVHVRHSWHAHKNRSNGAFFLGCMVLLILSGYALYYLGDEGSREKTSGFHLWLGMASPCLLILHIWFGRRATSR